MKTFFYLALVITAACLLGIATESAYGHPGVSSACTICHNDGSGSLTPSPDPLSISKGGSGLLSFDVASLPDPTGNNMISLTDLWQADLDASIGVGGDNWSLGTPVKSDQNISTGPYVLDLNIGLNAVLGTYNLIWYLSGGDYFSQVGGAVGTSGAFTVNVIPEPSTFALAGLGIIGICAGYLKRRR